MNSSGTVYTCLHPSKVYSFGPPGKYLAVSVPICITNIFLLVFILLGNVGVIMAYCWDKTLQTVPNLLLITLAISDVVVGLTAEPLFVTILIRDMMGLRPSCSLSLLSSLSNKFCGGVSMMTVSLVISSERYLAIVHPLKHRRLVTKARIKLVLFSLWFLLFLLNCTLLLRISYKVYYLVLSAIIPIGVVVTAFACYAILNKWNTSRSRQISIGNANRPNPRAGSVLSLERKDFKIAVTMFFIMGAIVFCYAPLLGALIYVQIEGMNEIYLKYLYPNVVTLVYLNSFLNPIIYCLRNRSFTRVIRKMIGFHRNDRRRRCFTINQPQSFQQNREL